MNEWITLKEACEILGVAPNTVRGLVRKGILPAYEIKGVRGFQLKRDDVMALISPVRVKTEKRPTKKPKV